MERRSADGQVTFLGSTDARVLEPGPGRGNSVAAARAHLDSVGRSLGLSNPGAQIVGGRAMDLGQGRSIVRFDQQIGGVPVFAGQVVVGLDSSDALTSVLSDVSPATRVAPARVPVARAKQVAMAVTSQYENTPKGHLAVQSAQQVVFDPSVAHVDVPGGARPAWEVQVGNGTDIREMVVVDGASGRVLLHYNQVADALDRTVCNNHNQRQSQDIACTTPVRVEGQGATGVADVDNAYRIAGQTAQAYSDIAGIDLTNFIGVGKPGHKQLRSTVNWCYTNTPTATSCPYDNAFWDGQQMYYGSGYASADDVVAHELSHGITQHTSDLMYYYQSGAMNESFSDIMGEIVDHRYRQPGEAAGTEWLLGEDLPGGALRNMADPTQSAQGPQPDSMTSPYYVADNTGSDNGGVHTNSGVGNKLFYLISQGGTLNNVTVTGIDGTDTTLAKSARLFFDSFVSLTSGSEYADLGTSLLQHCGQLAADGTLGFTQADCTQVQNAIDATQLMQSPPGDAAQPTDAPNTCPDPATQFKTVLFDGEAQSTGLSTPDTTMWTRAPNAKWGVDRNARSGVGSWFVWDPYPAAPYNDPPTTTLSTVNGIPLTSITPGQPTYVRFEHWRVFDYDSTPTYYDGGTLDVSQNSGSGSYTPVDTSGYTWVNGPAQTLQATGAAGFGGDSHGWVSTRLDLTPLDGSTIKLGWTAHGTSHGTFYGWFLDNMEVYTCAPTAPTVSAARELKAVASGSPTAPVADLSWIAPLSMGSGIDHYQVLRSDGTTADVIPGDPLPLRETGLKRFKNYTFKVRAFDADGRSGALVSHTIRALKVAFGVSSTRVRKGSRFTLSGRVYLLNGRGVRGLKVYVEYKTPVARKWKTAGYVTTHRRGKYAVSLTPTRTYVYRILVRPSSSYFSQISGTHKVRVVR